VRDAHAIFHNRIFYYIGVRKNKACLSYYYTYLSVVTRETAAVKSISRAAKPRGALARTKPYTSPHEYYCIYII